MSESNGQTQAPTMSTVPTTMEVVVGGADVTMLHGTSQAGNPWWNAKVDLAAPEGFDLRNALASGQAQASYNGQVFKVSDSGIHLSAPRTDKNGKARAGTGGNPTFSQTLGIKIGDKNYRITVQVTHSPKATTELPYGKIIISAKCFLVVAPAAKTVGAISTNPFL